MGQRILHLVTAYDQGWNPHDRGPCWWRRQQGSPADSPALACLAAMSLTPNLDHHVLMIGGSRVERRLQRLGFRSSDRIAPACYWAWNGRRAVRRYLRGVPGFDIIQPWDTRLQAMIPTEASNGRCRVRPAPATADLTPLLGAVHAAPIRADSVLRESASGPERLPVVLFGADPPDAGDAASLFRVLGLTDKCGYRFSVVLPQGVRGIKRVTRLHRDIRALGALVVSERSALEWLPMADAVLTVAVKDDREPLLRAAAMARGIPVVQSPVGARTMREYFAPAATCLREILDARPATTTAPEPGRPADAMLREWWS